MKEGQHGNITGNLQIKNGKYYVLVNLYDYTGKRTIKWVALGLDRNCGKKLARARMNEVLDEYNRSQERLMRAVSKKKHPELFISERDRVQSQPITEYLRDWVIGSKNRLQASTYDGYLKMINGRITEFFGKRNITVGDLAGEDLNEFYDYLDKEGLCGTSVQRYHGIIHAALRYAIKHEYIDDDPCTHCDRPKRENYRASFYSDDEVRTLLAAAKNSTIYIPVLLSAYYGLRRSETLGVRWSSIDFRTKTLSVSHKVVEANIDGRYQPKGYDKLKNKSSNRMLPLIPEVERVLLTHKEHQAENMRSVGEAYDHSFDGYVCTDELGRLISPNYLSRSFTKLLRQNGLRHIRFHDLRHTCASLLLQNGIPMKAIQEWLGHSTFEVTANTYAHLDYSSKERSARQISALLGGD